MFQAFCFVWGSFPGMLAGEWGVDCVMKAWWWWLVVE